VRVYRSRQATNEVERLTRKYRDLWDYIEPFERLLANGQTHGHEPYPGLRLTRSGSPLSVWKARVIVPQLGGKRSGLRYVYERLQIDDEDYAVALTIYLHQEDTKENDVRSRIRERSGSFDGTKEGLRDLDRADQE